MNHLDKCREALIKHGPLTTRQVASRVKLSLFDTRAALFSLEDSGWVSRKANSKGMLVWTAKETK